MNPSLVAGADGSKAGWVFVVLDTEKRRIQRCSVAPTFSELLLQTSDCAAVGIDIPIGLPDRVARGGPTISVLSLTFSFRGLLSRPSALSD